jgi:hypothetical protein
MKHIFLTLCIAFLLIGCANNETKQAEVVKEEVKADAFAKFVWVLGDWNNMNSETQSFEHWERESDSSMVAYSLTLRDTDTVFHEQMRLFLEDGTMKLYIETVGDNPNPVVFELKKDAEHVFTFENLRNEFPSQIVYTNPEPKKIKAWVAGFIDSVPQKQEFYFVRVE